jgi:hypothetical protein
MSIIFFLFVIYYFYKILLKINNKVKMSLQMNQSGIPRHNLIKINNKLFLF